MLTEAELEAYGTQGFVTPDFKLPEAVLEKIRQRHDLLLKNHPEFNNYCSTLLAYDTEFLSVARHPEILVMVAQVLGHDFALWNSSFFAKPANGGHATPWHQDGEYWPIEPLATCTVWIAVDPSTVENGCLQVIPGSHEEQRLKRHKQNNSESLTLSLEIEADEYDAARAVPIELEAGQVSLHDVYLVHGSEANNSNHSRRGMTLRFMPTTSVFNRKKATRMASQFNMNDHAERTLYLLSGVDQSGKNDFKVRR